MTEPKTPLLERARTLLQEGDYKPLTTQFAADVGSWLYDYRAEESALQQRVAELEALLDRASDMLTDNVGACYCESPGHQPGCKLDEWCRDYAKLEARNDA